MNKPEPIKIIAQNRKAFHDYTIIKQWEAGIRLRGSEVKSCRDGKVQLVDSYAAFDHRGELYLHKANIAEYKMGGPHFNHQATAARKLLMHRRELRQLKLEVEKAGYSLIPLKFYLKRGLVKVEIGLAKGKKKADKRDTIKERENQRHLGRLQRRERP